MERERRPGGSAGPICLGREVPSDEQGLFFPVKIYHECQRLSVGGPLHAYGSGADRVHALDEVPRSVAGGLSEMSCMHPSADSLSCPRKKRSCSKSAWVTLPLDDFDTIVAGGT